MNKQENRGRLIPDEPVVILILIGMILIGALLYYRAVNLQRFLEPALAVLEPRTQLSMRLKNLAKEELGPEYGQNVIVQSSGLMLHKSLFSTPQYHGIPVFINRLGNMIQRLFEDPWMSSNVEIVMIKTSVPMGLPQEIRNSAQEKMQQRSEALLNAILGSNSVLSAGYSDKFAATAVLSRKAEAADWIALDIIPSERLHIEILEKLGKYAHKPAPTN